MLVYVSKIFHQIFKQANQFLQTIKIIIAIIFKSSIKQRNKDSNIDNDIVMKPIIK